MSSIRLVIAVGRSPTTDGQATELEILVGDQSIHRGDVPTRSRNHREPARIEVPLDEYVGQNVTLTIVQHPAEDQALVEWLGIDLKSAVNEQPDGTAAPAP